MSRLIRKQVYLHQKHQTFLQRMVRLRGLSEAEIIRQALDREEQYSNHSELPRDDQAWAEVLKFVDARSAAHLPGKAYPWSRQDAYEDRLGRMLREKPEEDQNDGYPD